MEDAVRIVVLDFYMSSPIPGLDVVYSEFRGASVNQVPILRCFGSTKSGQKICVHIHGVFPYLYIPYDGVGNADGRMYQIAANIDKAVNISLNQGSSTTQHVYKISLVSGIPMYGYHPKKHQFFKIFLYNPMLMSTVTNLLVNRSIQDKVFQPHEAHINFTLQFMIDHNLHGMSNMIISDLKYRADPDNRHTSIDKELFLPASIEKITLCELEGDINAEHILNRQEIISGNLAVNPGIAALWADEKQRRRNKHEDSQLGPFLELKNMKFTPTKTHSIFQQALAERLAVLSTDKDLPNETLSISVYPAETPNNVNLQNASLIDIHTPSSLELSLDDTFNISSSQTFNDTITPTQGSLNVTMDEDANNFLQLLEKLAEEKVNEKEDDSILSQNVKGDDRNDDSNEDFLDLSMPLAAVTTPKKTDMETVCDKSDEEDDNYFNTTLIPQLDGQAEMSGCNDRQIIGHMTRSIRRQRENLQNNPGSLKSGAKETKKERTPKKTSCVSTAVAQSLPISGKYKADLSEISNKRRRSTPSVYISCDGAVDSSSEDEEKITKRRKRTKRSGVPSQYVPLQISVTKSPIVQGNRLRSGLADSMVGISGDQANFQEDYFQAEQKRVTIKRKLNFENGVPLNTTIFEEFLSCAFSPQNISKTKISTTSNNSKTSEKSDIPQVEIAHTDVDQFTSNSQSVDGSNSQHLDTTYSDSDLFSENEDLNRSFFRSYQLPVSEQYDKETKYKAREGCSTVFTPNSIVNSNIVLSPKSLTIQGSSDNTCSDIAPYQDIQQLTINRNKVESQTVTSVLSSENESSDITPYQKIKKLSNNEAPIGSTNSVNLTLIKPSLNAPTRLQVERSLDELKIVQVKVEEPFYSNVEDYTGTVEVGHAILRIPSKTSCHCADFESDFDSLSKYRKRFMENVTGLLWNSNNLKNLKLSHCSNRNIIIRPVQKPPPVKIVKQWLEENSKQRKCLLLSPDLQKTRPKIYIPNSPGNDQDDLELSLSVTPCTPSFSQTALTQSSEPATPNSSLTSQSSSPILDNRKKKCKKKNLLNKLSLRESLLTSGEANKSCQITGLSQPNSFGFDMSVQNLQAARAVLEYQNLTTLVMELHIRTRGDLKPDPEYDPICAIFYSVLNDAPETYTKKSKARGVVALNCLPFNLGVPNEQFLDGIGIDCDITYAPTEEALIQNFVSLINYWDPDIFAGYEIQMLSWGYLVDRAFALSINIIPLLGRSQINKYGRAKQKTTNYEIETAITGRIILDVWRIMRHEIALQSYTLESIAYHILHRRIPMFAFKDLTFWWDHRTSLYRHRVLTYYLSRVETVLELFHKLDFLNRTSELARLFGILFYEVLSRGSQFRVESMMLRLAKPLNYVPVSPSTAQRARMKAPEYISLVMEPESKMYNDPIIVLDFQSLYPSIIIAYNYCFTTCIGRVHCLGTNSPYEFGATQLKIPRKIVEKLSKRNLLNFSPSGVAFVKQKVRQGILPRMLTEILDTRLMVKNSMKENKGNENLQKVLHSRQLGLKLIANVTYGYTAANFSGRMCCVEVGDSVVSKARETLQRAIALVENTAEWGARVVYGDTDSLFVIVPGKTKEIAFEVGKKIADAITADNPDPIKLKLEKVYQPCILQTKKRYVGYMYESPDQKEPVYDAKGIETVRRDGCPAVSKMLQKCLTLLFETKDVSLIKKYILRQFHKIQAGRASIQDLTFAKEYRGASGYKPGACVPALELARKWRAVDRRNEPRSGERVPYIIVNGPPGLPLIRLVRSPRDLLNDSSLRPNSLYYISKVIIPPINRCLNLIGADLHIWFNQMPRKNTLYLPNSSPIVKSTISQYFVSKICASCAQPSQNGLCDSCCRNVNVTTFTLTEKLRKWEENFHNTKLICHSCTGHLNEVACISLDCPVLYRRTQTYNDLQQSTYVRELLTSTDIFSEDSVFGD